MLRFFTFLLHTKKLTKRQKMILEEKISVKSWKCRFLTGWLYLKPVNLKCRFFGEKWPICVKFLAKFFRIKNLKYVNLSS
jgi:hypothetical protein